MQLWLLCWLAWMGSAVVRSVATVYVSYCARLVQYISCTVYLLEVTQGLCAH